MCAKRREKGDGSVYQRSSDGMYVAYARLPSGKKKYVYDKTRTGVAKKLRELQKNIEAQTVVTARAETVESYLWYWLDIRHEQRQIKDGTYTAYKSYIATICKHIGTVKLTKLTGDKLQAMYGKLQKNHKLSTIRLMHTILSTAFKQAIKWKKLAYNPCQDTEVAQSEKYEGPVLTPEQALALLAQAEGHPLEIFLLVALGTGMRKGEIVALKWNMVDLDKRQLKIERTASYLPDDTGHHRMVEGTPKTKASRRALALPQFVVDSLKTHKRKQLEQRLQTGAKWRNNDLVFCTATGNLYNVDTLRVQFNRLLERAGLPHMHIHDLRHSAAALLLHMGVPMKVIQEILGHSSIKITMDIYGHLLPGAQEGAMDKMDRLFSPDRTQERREGTKE